ncbi:histidine kinase [Clostridia bacterium]|nr:histidine kinase [Clostridia bacterium]
MNDQQLAFKVSAGLKNIIGKDLISDRYIAVFELVKNSYDAGATKVIISFITDSNGNLQLIIEDDGCGMNYNDIVNKWLFVAYSEKKPQNRPHSSFRDHIKREVAGAKGVGRFSCDRLGETLLLETKVETEQITHRLNINWSQFEFDDHQEFMEIPVDYTTADNFSSPFEHGTKLIIENLREKWDRESLLKLKQALMKLISPDSENEELPFEIEIVVPAENDTDNQKNKDGSNKLSRETVNGIVHNDVFEKLNLKTTNIIVEVSRDGRFIHTKLFDRGDYIFTAEEKNAILPSLKDVRISLFYLNRAAKNAFTRQMGVHSVNYGSVFIYKNGFRISPYGDPEKDFFEINTRKAQGYNRYLGTREIMGRISITGLSDDFVETSSRDHGFIATPAVEELAQLFIEKALKVLEKYVVQIISWAEPRNDKVIMPSDIEESVISRIFGTSGRNNLTSFDCNHELLKSKATSDDSISSTVKKLEQAATDSGDESLAKLAHSVKKRTDSILSQNAELENENSKRDEELRAIRQEASAREKQVYFLSGATNQKTENLISGMHSIFTLTEAVKKFANYMRSLFESSTLANQEDMLETLAEIYQANQKVNKLAELAIHGNQQLKQQGKADICDFILQYIDAGLELKGLSYLVQEKSQAYDCEFDPSSVGIIIDNVASNSLKAHADKLEISFDESEKYILVSFTDNGIGLVHGMNPLHLFELGFSTTNKQSGFGIGLYHIKLLVEDMHGSVVIDKEYIQGFRLVVSFKK